MAGSCERGAEGRRGRRPRWPRRAMLALTLCLLTCLWTVPFARADGGAPNLVYVAGAGAGGQDVAIVDIAARKVTASVPTGSPPAGIVLSVDGRFAYLTQPALNRVAVLDTRAKQVVATIPVGARPGALAIVPTATTTELLVALRGGNAVAVVDANARRVLRTIPVCDQPVGLAVAGANSGIADPTDPEVYVACAGSRSVVVFETAQNQIVATVPLSVIPASVVVPATGGAAYVTSLAGTIEAVSLADHHYIGVVYQRTGARFGTMDYDAITSQVYVPDAAAGVVDVLAPVAVGSGADTATIPHEPARVLSASGEPSAVAITFDGAYGFIARRAAGSIVMLDPASHRELATIAVGGAPSAMVTGPYPPALSGQTAFILDMLVIGLLVVLMGSTLVTAALEARRKRARRTVPAADGAMAPHDEEPSAPTDPHAPARD